MSRTVSRLRSVLVVAAVSVGALTFAGCSAVTDLFPREAARDAETQEISEAGDADVFTLSVGDCFNDQDATEISSVEAIPCTDAHDYEAYFSFNLEEADSFPGDTAITDAAEAGCGPEFVTFVGKAYEESVLDYNYLTPTEGSWDGGDREILCLIFGADQTTGSLKGVAL